MCIGYCRCGNPGPVSRRRPERAMAAEHEPELSVRDQMVENQKVIDRLNAELARRTDEVRIIQQISSEINSTLDLDSILAISLHAMDSVLGFKHSMILLADKDEKLLRVAASRGYDGHAMDAAIPVGHGVFGVAARRRHVVRMGNLGALRPYIGGVGARMQAAGQVEVARVG